MSQCEATRQSDWITPPIVGTDGKSIVAALAVTTVSAFVDLTTLPGAPAGFSSASQAANPNAIGHYITLVADADVYVLFGPTSASVTTGNVPNPATTTTVTSGAIAVAAGICDYIPAGTRVSFKIPLGDASAVPAGSKSPARFMAFVTKTGTATLRVYQSSP